MSATDIDYFARRLAEERARAQAAATADTAEVHRELAREYEQRLRALAPARAA